MLYKTPAVQWETRMSGNSIGEKIWGALKRKLMGESLFLTYFRAHSAGEVGFAGSYPGRIEAFDLAAGQTIMVQRDSFLCAQSSARLDIALVKRLGAGFFGGEGFIMQKIEGDGFAFMHAGGYVIEKELKQGEVLKVDTGCVVAYTPTMDFDIEFVRGIKNVVFGGEGLFFARLTGPGKVWIQSLPISRLASRIVAYGSYHRKEEGSVLGGLGNLFDGRE